MTTLPLHPAFAPARATSRHWSHLALLAIALGGLALTLLTHRYFGTFIRGADAQMYFAQVRSLVVDGDLAFENEITQLSPQRAVFYDKAGNFLVARTADGRVINKYTFGWALITLPAYATVHATQSFTGGDTSGYSTAYDLATGLWHLAIVIIACAVLLRTATKLTDDRSAAIAVAATFFATNVAYYTSVYPTMAHGASFAVVALALALAVHLHENIRDGSAWLASALIVALVVLLRPTDLVLMAVFAPAVIKSMRSRERLAFARPAMLIVGIIAAITIQLIVWRISYGQWVISSYSENGEGFNWLSPAIPAILLSANHGAWYFHPFLLVGFIGLMVACCTRGDARRSLWLAMICAVLAHVYVHAAWHDWAFSHSFGHRLFANSAPLIALGAATLFHRLSSGWLRCAVGGMAVLIGWNALLMITFIRGGFPPVGEVGPDQLLAAQLKTIGSFLGW